MLSNLRSLLLAAIVLINCVAWTSSRHHYSHNVAGHRIRHRRQGAGLFLSASYVIPGGEGTGWGDWGNESPCSRTCGGGVASQKRICLQFGPDGQPTCTGGDTKYFSCQTQDCPDEEDFRSQQCAEYNDVSFRGIKYKWVPYTRAPNPCELNCMPHGERFYYRQKKAVVDGTRCNDESFDVCVNGTCQPVGCDMMLGSSAREDKCRECRGNGVNCHTLSGLLDTQELIKGYNEILLIPEGATTIIISEVRASNNYLALRAKNGTYYLNGDYHIDFPRSIIIAGALWYYERSQQGFRAPDKLRCLGPIKEPLYLSLLLQDENVGIEYEYSLPKNSAPRPAQQYNWVHEEFTPCSVTCGGGTQTRNVTCRSREELNVVDDSLCDERLKPPVTQACSIQACDAQWVAGSWGECSKKCGKGGTRNREVRCEKVITNGFPSIVADKECFDLLGPKPELYQECNVNASCPTWFVGSWKPCDKLCDEGKQKRQVVCYQKDENNRKTILGDEDCEDEKPETEKSCMLEPCIGVDWMLSDWEGCDNCLSVNRTRIAECATKDYKVVDSKFCAHHLKPILSEPCDSEKLPPCEVQWYATQWSKCSVDCGDGVQTRKVFCGRFDGESVTKVEDELCKDQPKYNSSKPCTVPKEKCPSKWYAGPWSECSKACESGDQTRLVICLKGGKPANDCVRNLILNKEQSCNPQPCNEDEVLPVNPSLRPVIDDYEDCEEDYGEVGLDEEVDHTDLMFSDSPDPDDGSGYDEPTTFNDVESSFPVETGSGSDIFTTDDFIDVSSSIGSTTDFEGSGETELISSTESSDSTSKSDFIGSIEPEVRKKNVTETKMTKIIKRTEEGSTEAGDTEITDMESTISTITEETYSTISSSIDDTSSTEFTDTDITDETYPTETEITKETSGTLLTEPSTESSPTDMTSISGSTESEFTDTVLFSSSTESTITEVSEATSPTDLTESILTDETSESSATESTITEETSASSSTESTLTEETSASSSTESTVTKVTSSAESTVTEETSASSSTESTVTEVTSSAESTVTEETSASSSTDSTITEETSASSSTDSTITEETSASISIDSTITEETSASSSTDSTITEETSASSSTDSTITEKTSASSLTESTITLETSSSSSTDSTTAYNTEETTSSEITESTITDKMLSSLSTDSDISTKETTTTIRIDIDKTTLTKSLEYLSHTTVPVSEEESSTTETGEETASTENISTTEVSSTKSTELESSTSSVPESSIEVTTEEDTSDQTKSTDATESEGTTTEPTSTAETKSSSTSESETTETETSTASGSVSTESETLSTTEASSTEIESSSTTTAGSTETETTGPTGAISTEMETSSTTESGSTETETSSTTESGSTETESSVTTETETTETVSSTTESTSEASTESTVTEISSSSLSTETTEATTTGATEETSTSIETTESSLSTTEEPAKGTTIWDYRTTMGAPKRPKCRKKKVTCAASKFGCCLDNKTPAAGPFDKGCPKLRTCTESKYGCCPDGVSPASGLANEGCPIEPCVDTLFGCCLSDNKTAAEGNDQEGCPPPPPACKSSEFGCCEDEETEAIGPDGEGCPEKTTTEVASESTGTEMQSTSSPYEESTLVDTTDVTVIIVESCLDTEYGCCADNETIAEGPNEQGCPCNTTVFGCCKDGVTSASGVNFAGCPAACNSSRYGCCPDGETPAHGPGQEGCCLLYAYGCCPDNRKPAEGPRLEGCGCQYAPFGCCPDNATYAHGYDNKGCGCQYTEHGCCPDRHTEATGPNFEGCSCNTYQFGCCQDGVTAAKGPGQQGCHCQQTTFGCCGDEQTAATGPDQQGCDCSSSKFGCCPDGVTAATGAKFLGCTDVPENKQEACSMPIDRGSCNNYTVHWFYDMEYGGCSRFWYGGCEGNGNRFGTKEECEDVCVHPPPKDACKLPKSKGACQGYHVKWHYDSENEQCRQFVHGGCLGNDNKFETREQCQAQCEPTRTADQCTLPIDRGSCAGNFARWGFNPETHKCEEFIWGGCEGNANRFGSEAACIQRCDTPGVQKLPDVCTLPAETGDCANYRERWYFDTTQQRCRQFYYGGCGGNNNNFQSREECEGKCSEQFSPTTTTTTTTTVPVPEPQALSEYCFMEIDAGPCTQFETRWAYDYTVGKCITFQYGGCGGNGNNFPAEKHCQYYCRLSQDVCQLPMMSGPCDESLMRWFYDPSSDSCSQFTYGGCEGNDNRFESRDDCERRCRVGPLLVPSPTPEPTTTVISIESRLGESSLPQECTIAPTLEQCERAGEVWYMDTQRRECVPFDNIETGVECMVTGVFASQEACERSCGVFRNIDVCRYDVDPGPCQNYQAKYYFDAGAGKCMEYAYGGCHGGPNRFSTIDECMEVCKPLIDPCKLGPEPGNCLARFVQWYYIPERGECSQFIYTGCGGNTNRFESRADCEVSCKRGPLVATTIMTTTTRPTTTHKPLSEECRTPSSLEPCGANVTAYYYNSETYTCEVGVIGGCGYQNRYRSEEECERRCGAFKDTNVCHTDLDPGSCRMAVPKFYWDAASGSCQPYTYSGCNGGPNRFSSVDECMELCGPTGPDTNEVLPDCSMFSEECSRAESLCSYGVEVIHTEDGCTRCTCKPVNCERFAQECDALVCGYGVLKVADEDGCTRCSCHDDPCKAANCSISETCRIEAYRDPITQEARYNAHCEPDITNEILPECDRYNEECLSLRCEFGVQRTRTASGCERCSCVPVEVDCTSLREECDNIHCNYGIDWSRDHNGCPRCTCTKSPCLNKACSSGERCVVISYRDAISTQIKYSTECRAVNKTGFCPANDPSPSDDACLAECHDDAECRGVAKCCLQGCANRCLVPVMETSTVPTTTTTIAPEVPRPPAANTEETQPEVTASEGGKATLRCLFHGNPPPKITWARGEITIDGSVGRYRLLSDGALEIVSLYRNDSGVYICIANNELGTATQEIRLEVSDPVKAPAGIAGEENAVVTGDLGKPLILRCLTYGYPKPAVFWYRGVNGPMVPFSSAQYEASFDILKIRRLTYDTLGEYVCQAYNGVGKASSWLVVVRAYQPEAGAVHNMYLVTRDDSIVDLTSRQPKTETSSTTSTPTPIQEPEPEPEPDYDIPIYIVPVSTNISATELNLVTGKELTVTCDVNGYPEPDVYWTKDSIRLVHNERIWISGTSISRLTIPHVSTSDSGLYACHAVNAYGSHYSTVQVTVQAPSIPAKCVDNPYFANCTLIVRNRFCTHVYYSRFCCKSCMEAGQLSPEQAEMQSDQPYARRK